MKASIGARRYSVFSLSKKLFGVLIFTATLFSFSYTTFAAIPPQYANYRLEYYDRWFTLFGNPTATVEREQVKNREASGIAYKGIKNCSSVIQVLQPAQPVPTTPTITNPAGISGCVTPTGGGLVGIKDIDLLVSLDKRMRNQSDFQYENGNNTTVVTGYSSISSLDFYKDPKNRAEYTYDMIGEDSGSGPRGFGAFLIKTTYTTTLGRERTIFSVVPNKKDSGETSVVEKESFIIDYDSNRNEIEQQSVVKNVVFGEGELAAKPGTTATSTFWYCGGKQNDIPGTGISTSGIVGDGTDPLDTDIRPEYKNRIARFAGIKDEVTNATNTFCGGTAYYQIGSDLTYQIPNSIDEAVQQQVDNADLVTGQTRRGGASNLPSCKTGTFSFNLLGCIAQGLYGLIFYPISFVAGLLGQIFDWFLAYSLSDESYRHTFVETAWRLVRDISNIFFIIIMVYTGLSAVFSTSSTSYKRVIPALIVNALLINFSLFAARIVIDISNITARLFYNQITVTVDGSKSTATVKPISEAIVSAFNPQRVFDNVLAKEVITTEDTVAAANGTVTFNGTQDFGQKRDDWTVNDTDYAQYFILVTIMASLIMWGVAMMFWKTAFLFVGRVIQLYISMIFSPFAFLSRDNIPLVSKISALKFDTWWGDLSKSAIMAPIFIFFLYIINAFLGIEFFDKVGMSQSIAQGSATLSFFDSVLKILIPMLLIYGLIGKAVDIAKMFSTSIGNSVQNAIGGFANKAVGIAGTVAVGAATGGIALAGRGVGLAARGVQQNSSIGRFIQRNQTSKSIGGAIARATNRTLSGAQTASYDMRNTNAFKTLTGTIGKDLGIKVQGSNALVSALNLDEEKTKGGLKAYDKRKEEETKKKIESLEAKFENKEDAKAFYESVQAKEFAKAQGISQKEAADIIRKRTNDKEFEKEAKEDLDQQKADGTIYGYGPEAVEKLKKQKQKEWEDQNKKILEDLKTFSKEQDKQYGIVKDNDSLTQALRLRYADNLKNDSSTVWNTIRQTVAPVITTTDALYSTERKEKAAGKYGDDKRKQFKKDQKVIEAEEKINADINKILEDAFSIVDATLQEKITDTKTKDGKFNHTDLSDEERERVIKKWRSKIDTDLQIKKAEVDELKKAYLADRTNTAKEDAYISAQRTVSELTEEKDGLKNIIERHRKAAEKVEKLKGDTKNEKPKDDAKGKTDSKEK